MKKFNHPNILKAHEFFRTTKKFFVVTDYCKDSDLKTFMHNNGLKYFTEE